MIASASVASLRIIHIAAESSIHIAGICTQPVSDWIDEQQMVLPDVVGDRGQNDAGIYVSDVHLRAGERRAGLIRDGSANGRPCFLRINRRRGYREQGQREHASGTELVDHLCATPPTGGSVKPALLTLAGIISALRDNPLFVCLTCLTPDYLARPRENSALSPSAIVGCVRMASRSAV
jgi:hypothetical protein